MKKRPAALVFGLLILLLLPGAAPAANGEGGLSLTEAIQTALDNNYEVKAEKSALAAAYEDIGVSESSLLPKLAVEERFMRTTNPTYAFMSKLNQERFTSSDFAVGSLNNPNAVNDFQTSLSFEQPLFEKGSYIGLRMAKLEHAAKNEDYLRKREEIAFKVTQSYLAIIAAGERAAFARRSLEDAREHQRIAELRYRSGLGLFSDTLRASTAAAGAAQRLVSAGKDLAIAKKALSLILGTDAAADISGTYPEIPVRDSEYYSNAALSRRDIKSMEAVYENTRNGIALSDAAYWPTLGIGGSYQLNDHRNPFGAEGSSWTLTAFARWELFDGERREHEKARARYKSAEEEERLKGLRNDVSFKVYAAYLGIGEAKENMELARAALKTAEEGKRLVEARYENSLAPLVDLLDAQTSLDRARAELSAGERAYWAAVAGLAYESGTILKDLNIE